jgi:hypothetical protein
MLTALAVQGAFVLLMDDTTPYFLAGTPEHKSDEDGGMHIQSASWLGVTDTDLQQWLWTFQQTASCGKGSGETNDSTYILSVMEEDEHLSNVASVRGAPHLSFYAGTPVVSKPGTAIGVVFVVDDSTRKTFSNKEKKLLQTTARQCMAQLEFVRESAVQERWKMMNEHLTRFVGSRAVRDQELEEPAPLGREDQQQRRKEQIKNLHAVARQNDQKFSKVKSVAMLGDNFSIGPESERLSQVETKTARRVEEEDKEHEARSLTAHADNDTKTSDSQSESTYRKIFRRAAECLQEALQADGVLFTDGVIGHHGTVQPILEGVEELEHEINQRPERRHPEANVQDGVGMGSSLPGDSKHQQNHSGTVRTGSSRTYTSAEFKRGAYLQRPAEIIGMSTRNSHSAP